MDRHEVVKVAGPVERGVIDGEDGGRLAAELDRGRIVGAEADRPAGDEGDAVSHRD